MVRDSKTDLLSVPVASEFDGVGHATPGGDGGKVGPARGGRGSAALAAMPLSTRCSP